jgi:hypothetical protein
MIACLVPMWKTLLIMALIFVTGGVAFWGGYVYARLQK